MDFYSICIIVGFVLLVLYGIVDFIANKKNYEYERFKHDSELSNKWILQLDKTYLMCVKGDFWVSYDSKCEKPFSVNCGDCSLGHYESEERCRQILVELSHFIADDSQTVFTMP